MTGQDVAVVTSPSFLAWTDMIDERRAYTRYGTIRMIQVIHDYGRGDMPGRMRNNDDCNCRFGRTDGRPGGGLKRYHTYCITTKEGCPESFSTNLRGWISSVHSCLE